MISLCIFVIIPLYISRYAVLDLMNDNFDEQKRDNIQSTLLDNVIHLDYYQ